MHVVQFERNQKLLMEVPALPAGPVREDREHARAMVQAALTSGQTVLAEPDGKQLLAAYGIPVVPARCAASAEEAARMAAEIGFPVALKLLSPDLRHKSDIGGVVLDLETPTAVREAAQAMCQRLQSMLPQARFHGFSVQAMARRPHATELVIGVGTDPVFGPAIVFGHGGIAVAATGDHALALPPLNMVLARDLVGRTRVSRLLAGFSNRPAADIDAICTALIQVSHLVVDIPEIAELDINPLLADADGVIALDARIRLQPASGNGIDRLAIRPYPAELEETVDWQEGRMLLRPIRPEDGPQHVAFFNSLHPEDVRYRIFTRMRELQPVHVARLTQVDYDREMAFIATRDGADGRPETLGVVRAIADPDNQVAEFAIIVRSDMKGKGLGKILMDKLVRYCRARGLREVIGDTLTDNKGLIALARKFGFRTGPSEDGIIPLRLVLD